MAKEFLEKLKNAKTNEERKQIVEDNRSILTDDDLEQVVGGGKCGYTLMGCCK